MHLWIASSQTSVETFWSLLKEGADQSELWAFLGVLWDRAWPEVEIFITGVFILPPLRGGTGNGYQRGLKLDQRCIPSD